MVEGIDLPRVTDWLVGHVPDVEPPFHFRLIAGGRSNMTFAVTDGVGRRLVLRRPPLSHVLSTAHDMSREHRIISGLRDTAVPVPPALGYCGDEHVNGRPFYVMGFVDGYVLRGAEETEKVLGEPERRAAGENLVDVLAALHDVDVDAAGLGDLGRRDGYIERQLRRWSGQFERSQAQERDAGVHRPVPLVAEVHGRLAERVPAGRGVAIVHGDYRLDNTIVSADGAIRAVLDWELCTLGDALADLGTLLMYWADPDESGSSGRPRAATALPGFPRRSDLAARYAARSGRDLTDLPFYVAFAHWKLACILEGVYARYATGAMGSHRSDSALFARGVERQARLAMEALDGVGPD